jgi:hypothetical protein
LHHEGFAPQNTVSVSAWRTVSGYGKNKAYGELGGAVWDDSLGVLWLAGSGPGSLYKIQGYRVAADDTLTLVALIALGNNDRRDTEGLTLLVDPDGKRFLVVLIEGNIRTAFRTDISSITRKGLETAGITPLELIGSWDETEYKSQGSEAVVVVNDGSGGAKVLGIQGASDATTLGYLGAVVSMKHQNNSNTVTLTNASNNAKLEIDVGTKGSVLQGFEALAFHYPTQRFAIFNEGGDYAFIEAKQLLSGLAASSGPTGPVPGPVQAVQAVQDPVQAVQDPAVKGPAVQDPAVKGPAEKQQQDTKEPKPKCPTSRISNVPNASEVYRNRILKPKTDAKMHTYKVPDNKVGSLQQCVDWARQDGYLAGNWDCGGKPRCTKFKTWGKDLKANFSTDDLNGSYAFFNNNNNK